MHRHYRGLWLLLATALCLFVAYSFTEPVTIFGHEMARAPFADVLTAQPQATVATTASGQTATAPNGTATPTDSIKPTEQTPAPTDTAAKTILFIGDSMLEGLSPRLAAYATANGHTLYSVIWYSSTSEIWGQSDKITKYINRLHPDYIFISLGANELFVRDIKTKRDKYVKKMLADIGDIPYVWIGPPNWKPDTGINDLIAANAAPGTFFVSNGMHFDRSKDGAHPTRQSAIEWMDSVARWMPLHSAHPIRMDKPEARTGHPKRIFVHQPSER